MKENSIFNIPRILRSAKYSVYGLRSVWQNEPSFRIEILALIILLPIAFLIGTTFLVRALLISSIILILIAELINSAIEIIIDRISADHHELSGKAKDIGAAIVLLTIINAFVIWSFIFIHFCLTYYFKAIILHSLDLNIFIHKMINLI